MSSVISWPRSSSDDGRSADVATIADLVRRMEQQIDDVTASGAELIAALRDWRSGRGLSRVVGQPVDAAIGRAMALSSQAIDETVAAHRLLRKLAPALGIDPAMYGDCPDNPSFTGAVDRNVVAA